MAIQKLRAEQLRRVCDPNQFQFTTTAELKPSRTIIGQPRGVRAIEFGIQIRSKGYNIYVLSEVGSGQMALIRRFLEEKTRNQVAPYDWVYVHNFTTLHQPRAIEFPAGQGSQFKKQMDQLVNSLGEDMPRAFSTAEYEQEVENLWERVEIKKNLLMREIERKAKMAGFVIVKAAAGFTVTPAANGEIMTQEQYEALSFARKEEIDNVQIELENSLEETLKKTHQLGQRARQELQELDREVAKRAIAHHVETLTSLYRDHAEVLLYLSELHENVLDNVDDFRPMSQESNPATTRTKPDLLRYEVNLFVDNSKTEGVPVIVEQNPTYNNLIGRIEYEIREGVMFTHFTNIKPGSLHKANGGYLLIDAHDILSDPYGWEALKRAIKGDEIVLQPYNTLEGSSVLAKSIDPEAIPLDIKIILLGSSHLYYALYESEEEFNELFKVKADFSRTMARTFDNEMAYARLIASRCEELKMAHFTPDAVARVIEFCSERAEIQNKLTTHFGEVNDLVLEACFWSEQNQHTIVTAEDVETALTERIFRTNKVENLIDEDILRGTLLLATTGQVVGQVNGLSIIDMGDYEFGRPSRITARTYMGSNGVVHIERETNMADPIHSKGTLTMVGYLGGNYAQDYPLSISASLTFEQNYSGVGGDSASSAELYAILSSLSQLPINQAIAVTGSINQRGEIQPIGGVNAKIEGFFRICQQTGLTGEQGVIIPKSNVGDLMIHKDVIKAVEAGQFQIWAIEHTDDGIELLFGKPAGQLDDDGEYPEDSVHGIVQQKLARYAKKDGGEETESEESEDTEDEEAESA